MQLCHSQSLPSFVCKIIYFALTVTEFIPLCSVTCKLFISHKQINIQTKVEHKICKEYGTLELQPEF